MARHLFPLLAIVFGATTGSACSNSSPAPAPSDGGSPPSGWRSAVGAGGVFAQTFDDVTWRTRTVAPGALRGVACVGNLAGWVAGDGGFVAHTDDGGVTWSAEDAHVTETLHTIRFGTRSIGVIAGARGTLAVTGDGGASWRVTPPLTTATLHGAAVTADGARILVVGDGGALLRSSDAGVTWAASASAFASGADLRGVATDSEAHVVLVVDARGGIWASSDGGASFVAEASAASPLDAVALSDDGARAFAVGAAGTVLVRMAPRTWTLAPRATTADLHAALVSEGGFYAAGESGTLLGSRDGGRSWGVRPLATTAALYGLDDL